MSGKGPRFGAIVRMWFAMTPQERKLLFGILAVTLIGFTARYLHLRSREPTPVDPPNGEAVYSYEESTP